MHNSEGINITHPEKILFPDDEISKQDIFDYYKRISTKMIPLIQNRYLSIQRFPNGIQEEGFFQKNKSDYFPDWIKTKKVKNVNYVVCNDAKTLLYLANQAALVIHTWLSECDKDKYPTKMIFDLDPSKGSSKDLVECAKAIKKILESFGFEAYVMLTGSRGIHIVVPLKADSIFEEVRDFAKDIANIIVKINPKKFTIENIIAKRKNRLYIDVLRNSPSQTAVAPYSIRACKGATIAAPISWEELEDFNPKKYNIKNIFLRKNDPWKNFTKQKFSIKSAKDKLEKLKDQV